MTRRNIWRRILSVVLAVVMVGGVFISLGINSTAAVSVVPRDINGNIIFPAGMKADCDDAWEFLIDMLSFASLYLDVDIAEDEDWYDAECENRLRDFFGMGNEEMFVLLQGKEEGPLAAWYNLKVTVIAVDVLIVLLATRAEAFPDSVLNAKSSAEQVLSKYENYFMTWLADEQGGNTDETFKIRFFTNGGTPQPAVRTAYYGQPLGTLPTPTKAGYPFLGWTTTIKNTTQTVSSSTVINKGDILLDSNGEIGFFASWQDTYTINYDANGGTGAPAPQTKTKGVTLTLSSKIPTRSGYDFGGWLLYGTLFVFQPGEKFTLDYDRDMVMRAIWTTYNLGEETYRFSNYEPCTNGSCNGSGHCFGMSSTSSAYYLKLLDMAIVGGTYSNVYALNSTATVKASICNYQKKQGSYALQATVAGGNWYKKSVYNITSDWAAVINYVKSHAYDGKGSLQIGYRGTYNSFFSGVKEGGHAINFLRYEEVGGQPRIYAYDNNFPDVETYFYKDSQGKIRQAPNATFDVSIDCIALRDVSKYFSSVGAFDATRVIYADRGVISVEGAIVYPMDGIELGDRAMYEIPAKLNQVKIVPLVDNATFEYLDATYGFGEASEDTVGTLKLSTPGGNETPPEFTIGKDDAKKYIKLWGKQTKYESNFLNWFLCIVCFGWIWMWF